MSQFSERVGRGRRRGRSWRLRLPTRVFMLELQSTQLGEQHSIRCLFLWVRFEHRSLKVLHRISITIQNRSFPGTHQRWDSPAVSAPDLLPVRQESSARYFTSLRDGLTVCLLNNLLGSPWLLDNWQKHWSQNQRHSCDNQWVYVSLVHKPTSSTDQCRCQPPCQ